MRFFGVDSASAPPRPDDIFEEIPQIPFPLHILRFWTSAAYFSIGRKPGQARTIDCSVYNVYIPGKAKSVTSVILDNAWREERADEDRFEVIFLSHVAGANNIWTMLIEWNNGIAHRVQQFIFPLRFDHWKAAKPQFKLISLT